VLLGAKPVVQEVGPYVYTEEHHKSDLQWNTNGTVTYKQIRTWHYLPDRTPGSLDDQVSTLNIILVRVSLLEENPHLSIRFFFQ